MNTYNSNTNNQISPRESEVLHMLAFENTAKQIASKLYISVETVCSHRKNLMIKLDVKNTAGLVRVAMERGLISTPAMTLLGTSQLR